MTHMGNNKIRTEGLPLLERWSRHNFLYTSCWGQLKILYSTHRTNKKTLEREEMKAATWDPRNNPLMSLLGFLFAYYIFDMEEAGNWKCQQKVPESPDISLHSIAESPGKISQARPFSDKPSLLQLNTTEENCDLAPTSRGWVRRLDFCPHQVCHGVSQLPSQGDDSRSAGGGWDFCPLRLIWGSLSPATRYRVCSAKGFVERMKRQAIAWGKIFAIHICV